MTTGKTIALTRQTFVDKVMSLLFNMLSRLVITFLPRSKHLLITLCLYLYAWWWFSAWPWHEKKKGRREEERRKGREIRKDLEGEKKEKSIFFYFLFPSFTEIYLRYNILPETGVQHGDLINVYITKRSPQWLVSIHLTHFFFPL